MTAFWILAAGMVAAALLWVIPVLVRRSDHVPEDRDAFDLKLFRNRLAELEADVRNSTLNREEFEHSVLDLKRSLLEQTVPPKESANPARTRGGRGSALAVGVFLPIFAGAMYLWLGGGAASFRVQPSGVDLDANTKSPPEFTMESLSAALERLEKHLAEQPQDVDGWTLLARSYFALDRYRESVVAFSRATAVRTDDPQLLAEYAEAQYEANGKRMSGEPAATVERALAINPDHPKALWLAAHAALEANERDKAIATLEKLGAVLPADSENARLVATTLAALKGEGTAAPATPGKSASPAATSALIKGVVTLDAQFAGDVAPSDTLFVYALRPDGPRMPVAILRKQAGELPLEFQLDDSTTMSPQQKLSQLDSAIVVARISRSGAAMPAAGDLEGDSGTVAVGSNQRVRILINRKRP